MAAELSTRFGSDMVGRMTRNSVSVRPAEERDELAIWRILEPTLREGRTYALDPQMNQEEALRYWRAPLHEVFVAEIGGEVLGTYFMRANQAGGGSHVANCGYVTGPWASGRGVAKAMCLHSLEHAKRRGYRAMQFNFVVSTNERAVRLWQHIGFEIVGRLPEAFKHPDLGYVDALVMHRLLTL
jgi:ribosomal protein S18 acetylase RimI-like enzyme